MEKSASGKSPLVDKSPGQFIIYKGFVNSELKEMFDVNTPRASSDDHIEYSVKGIDLKNGPFTIKRRYSDFYALRKCFVERFPGLYVPPVPKKKYYGSKS